MYAIYTYYFENDERCTRMCNVNVECSMSQCRIKIKYVASVNCINVEITNKGLLSVQRLV